MKTNSILLVLILLFSACSKDSNPVGSSGTFELIGGIGSQRSYAITKQWFVPNTDTPFVVVPDSLIPRITLSDSLRTLGFVEITQRTESVLELDTNFYYSWKLPLPRMDYKMTQGIGPSYNLADEVYQLSHNLTYSLPNPSEQNVWHETPNQLEVSSPLDQEPIVPTLPWVKKPLSVGDSWIRYKFIDASAHELKTQISVRVVAQQLVSVRAGAFSAYKLEIRWYHFNPDYDFGGEYEYWVPNVGLVLSEIDRVVSIVTIPAGGGPSTTITVRQVTRKELLSWSLSL